MSQLMNFNMNEQQKISVNLSEYCLQILNMEMLTYPKETKFGSFVNLIITNYCDLSDASITNRIEDYRQQCGVAILKYLPKEVTVPEEASSAIIEAMCQNYAKELTAKALSYAKGRNVVFRLNNDLALKFFGIYGKPAYWPDQKYYDRNHPDPTDPSKFKIGRFFKAVLEEFARKGCAEREEIIYRDNIRKLKDAITQRRQVQIRLKDVNQNAFQLFYVCPYKVIVDGNHVYLTGVRTETTQRTSAKIDPISLRISKMMMVEEMTKGSGELTAEETAVLKEKLKKNGAAFLFGSSDKIEVKLTQRGFQIFTNYVNQRPALDKITEDGTYVFSCSQYQAEIYFQRFGKEAEIISPPKLRKRLLKLHTEAAEIYRS